MRHNLTLDRSSPILGSPDAIYPHDPDDNTIEIVGPVYA